MTGPLVIVGCGGFGREVWSILKALQRKGEVWEIEGFVDDSPTEDCRRRVQLLGSSIIGSVVDLAGRREHYWAALAIGDGASRMKVHATLAGSDADYPRLVHPDTTLGREVRIEEGAIVAAGARLSTNIFVGAHAHVDQNATVGHDVQIGNFVRLNPQACISGSVVIGDGALIGANATVLQGLRIGAHSTVGAGACVVHDVPPGLTVKGVPAR